jgi:uncharacterized protein (DUF952 family)
MTATHSCRSALAERQTIGHSERVSHRPADDAKVILHIAFEADWDEATRTGIYRVSTRGATLDEVGYIHASFEDQVARVGAVLYADVREPLAVLVIDADRLDVPVIVENLEGGDEGFPHIYGPLPTSAVLAVRRARVTSDGRFLITASGDA